MLRKLHTSEVLLLAAYAVLFASIFLVKDGAGEDLNFFTFIAMVGLSFWCVCRHKAISPVLYPYYLFLGYLFGALLGIFAGSSNAPAAIGMFMCLVLLLLIFLELICGIIFATKDSYKIFILVVLGFLVASTLDRIFITPNEMGEKGSSYPDWRVIEENE